MSILDSMRTLGAFAARALARLSWLPPFAARLVVGLVFLWSGWGKVHHLPTFVDRFREWGIPAPEVQAPLAAGTELICGALLIVGLFTRLAAAPLIVVMTVALATAYRKTLSDSFHDDGFLEGLNTLFGLAEFGYILLLLWLVVVGGGALSLDRQLFRSTPAKVEPPKSGG